MASGRPSSRVQISAITGALSEVSAKPGRISAAFNGSFANCHGSDATIKSGTVTASGSGSGGCTQSKTSGFASITWNNGRTSSLNFTTTGATAALVVQGTISSGEFAGKAAKAVLAFQATPTQCNTAAGVTAPTFTGVAEVAG